MSYDAMVGVSQESFRDAVLSLQKAYANNETDQFFKPRTRVDEKGIPVGAIKSNDVLLFWNSREDRARELSKAFISPEFNFY